jgi:sugar lactone lactonase YvrE
VGVDSRGVYVANGQILAYSPADREIAPIDVPERPIDIIFGGPFRRTLFILAHHALLSVRL